MAYVGILVASFVGMFHVASFIEWVLHKYLMHRPLWPHLPFRSHQGVHHHVCTFLKYHVQSPEQRKALTFNWWLAPIVLLCILVLAGVFELITPVPILLSPIFIGAVLAAATYYGVYEYIHYCMHVPAYRWFETTRLFRFVKRHHQIHHFYAMTKNFNVFCPWPADFLLGTFARTVPPQQVHALM